MLIGGLLFGLLTIPIFWLAIVAMVFFKWIELLALLAGAVVGTAFAGLPLGVAGRLEQRILHRYGYPAEGWAANTVKQGCPGGHAAAH